MGETSMRDINFNNRFKKLKENKKEEKNLMGILKNFLHTEFDVDYENIIINLEYGFRIEIHHGHGSSKSLQNLEDFTGMKIKRFFPEENYLVIDLKEEEIEENIL
jgi:hypothetical protein